MMIQTDTMITVKHFKDFLVHNLNIYVSKINYNTIFSSNLKHVVSNQMQCYIAQDSSSKLFIPLSATIIQTCRFNLLHTAITFRHFFTVSLWAQNLPFQKILSSTLVCFCPSDWSRGSIDCSPDLFAHRFYVLVLFFYVLVIPKCGRLSWHLVNF